VPTWDELNQQGSYPLPTHSFPLVPRVGPIRAIDDPNDNTYVHHE